jgi:hypothetical protein
MGLKSDLNRSREGFDKVLAVVGTLLPKNHVLPKTMYEAHKLLKALKMPYEQIRACPNGCRPLHSSGSTHSRLVQFNSSYIDLYIT